MNAEELRRLSDVATPGEWQQYGAAGEYIKRGKTTVADMRYLNGRTDAAFVVALVNAYRSNQLQVIERDRLDVERAAIAAAARLEGEVSDLRTQLAACSEAYAALREQGEP